ncbi:MAG: hypothetical protein KUG56_09505 [Kordiimonadaceae bacterium]|nr:hypothetical protein [Kordiimonadaceae bacterium]
MNIRDGRAILAALALVLTGAILSSMIYQYFAGQYTGAAILRSRTWWEIVMNLQVLSLAFIWFCYADRLQSRTGREKRVVLVRLLFGLAAVFVPTAIALISAFFGWFEKRPPLFAIDLMICALIAFWFVSTVIPRLVAMKVYGVAYTGAALWDYFKPRSWLYLLPVISLGFVFLADFIFSTENYYLAMPALFYGQAAMPFFFRGFGKRPKSAAINT